MRRIAVLTDDGKRVSPHLGRARYYLILTLEGWKVIHQEMVERGDLLPPAGRHDHHTPGDCHGCGAAAAAHHQRLLQPLAGCEALLAGGMSWTARTALIEAQITPVLTDIRSVNQALFAYLEGSIEDRLERLH